MRLSQLRSWLHHRVLTAWYTPDQVPPWWCQALSGLTHLALKQRPSFNAQPYRVPLIVVGNLTLGGNGKTPFVSALAKHLQQEGWHPGIICRGDGSRTMQPGPVSASLSSPHDATLGDEARLHARSGLPVWQGKQRHEVAQALLQCHSEVDILISDDGLQHSALHRDIEFVLLNADRGVGNGWLLPAGPLREPVDRLRTVDAIIVYRSHEEAPTVLAQLPGLESLSLLTPPPCFYTTLQLEPPSPLNLLYPSLQHPSLEWNDWAIASRSGHSIVALTAIAHPESFFNALRKRGIQLAATYAFPDHHPFTIQDLPQADRILITEKDAIKCTRFDQAPLWVVPSSVAIPEGIAALLRQRLSN